MNAVTICISIPTTIMIVVRKRLELGHACVPAFYILLMITAPTPSLLPFVVQQVGPVQELDCLNAADMAV